MSKATREGLFQDPGSEADSDDVIEIEAEPIDDTVDLKATVTLSGEALAALLEEVKKARGTATDPTTAPETGWPPPDASDEKTPG